MDSFLKMLEDTFNSGDPEIRTWFLIRQNYLPFILCGSYALFSSVLGPAIMKNRKPFDLRKPMIVFNFCIVATYTICLATIFSNLPSISYEQFCKGDNVKKGELTYILTRACWVIYLLKYVEFLDTVFFVLRKKDNLITFLHVMHHTIVPILGWIMFRTERSGFQSIPVLLNAFVHIIMYSYYGLAAMGPQVRKYLWWKKYLTQLQMIQFSLMILFVTVIAPLSGCTMVHFSYIMDILLAPLFLYLFYKFYQMNFQPKKKLSVANGDAKKNMLSNGENNNNVITNGISKKKD